MSRFGTLALASSLLMINGCGESTQEKMLRMAQERSNIRQAEEERTSAQETAARPTESPSTDKPAAEAGTNAAPSESPQPSDQQVVKKDETEANAVRPAKTAAAAATQTPATQTPATQTPATQTQVARAPVAPAPLPRSKARSEDDDRPRRAPVASVPDSNTYTLPHSLLDFLKGGERVAYVGEGGTIGLFDVQSQRVVRKIFNRELKPSSLAVSEEGSQLVVGGKNGHFKIFPINHNGSFDKFQQQRIQRRDARSPLKGHDHAITAVALDERHNLAVSGDLEGEIRLWRGMPETDLDLSTGGDSIHSLISVDRGKALVGLSGEHVYHWTSKNGSSATGPFDGFVADSPMTCIAVSDGGDAIAIGDESGNVTILESGHGPDLQRSEFPACGGPVARIAFGPDRKSIVTVSQPGDVARWPLPVASRVHFPTADEVEMIVVAPEGRMVGLSSHEQNLDLYSPKGEAVRRHSINRGKLSAADFSSSDSIVALGNNEGQIFFQDDKKKTAAYAKVGAAGLTQIARRPGNGEQFAFMTSDGSVGVADFPGRVETPLAVKATLAAVAPNTSKMIIARDGQVHLIDMAKSRLVQSAQLPDSKVSAVCVDGDRGLIGTNDGSVWTWSLHIPESNPTLLKRSAHSSTVLALTSNEVGDILSIDRMGSFAETPSDPSTSASDLNKPRQLRAPIDVVCAGPGAIYAAIGKNLASLGGSSDKAEAKAFGEAKISHIAVHNETNLVAAINANGQLVYQTGDTTGSQTQVVKLPFAGASSLLWSRDGRKIAVSNGTRLATVDVARQAVQSQSILDRAASKLLDWNENGVWFLDDEQSLKRARVPNVRWSKKVFDGGTGLAWAGDGSSIAALGRGGIIVQLDPEQGTETARATTGNGEARSLIALPDSQTFAFLSSNADVMQLNHDGTVERVPLTSAIGLRQIACSDDGARMFAVNAMGRIISWDPKHPDTGVTLVPSESRCKILTPLRESQLLTACDGENRASILPTSQLSEYSVRLGGPPSSTVLANHGSVAGFADGTTSAKVYALPNPEPIELGDASCAQNSLAINSDGSRAATLALSADDAPILFVWNAASGEQIGRFALEDHPQDLAFSQDSDRIAVSFDDGHTSLFDLEKGEQIETTPAVDGIATFALSGDNSALFVATRQGDIVIQSLLGLGHFSTGQNAVVSLNILSGDKPMLFCGSRNGKITLWDVAKVDAPAVTLEGIDGPLVACCLSPDQDQFCAVYEDAGNTLCVWNVDQLTNSDSAVPPTATLQHASRPSTAAFTDDSRFLLVGGVDGNIAAWNVNDAHLVATFTRHSGKVLSIQNSVEPGKFISGGEDERIRLSEFPVNIPPVGRPPAPVTMVESLAVADLDPPKILEGGYRDPYDAARQALVGGSSTAEVIGLIEGDENQIRNAKRILSDVLSLEQGSLNDARELSKNRRMLLASQQKLASERGARSLASFADGFSNLSFVAETNFNFGTDREFRPVRLLFADRFLYAARTSRKYSRRQWRIGDPMRDEGDNGALLSWDYRYSRLQAHAWSIDDLTVRELFPLPNSAGVFTVPQMLLFSQDGSTRTLPQAASWATSSFPESKRQFLAVGTEGAHGTESDILKVFDVAELSNERVEPLSQYRSFEGVVTAMAFANNSSSIAFCVRERAVHRLFIADAETLQLQKLEEFDHDMPWMEIEDETGLSRRNAAAAAGITSLSFSPDDRVLVTHGNYEGSHHKFTRWNLQWDDAGNLASFRKNPKELENEGGPLIQESGSKSIWFVKEPERRRPSKDRETDDVIRMSQRNQYRVLVRVTDGFMVVNLNSNREEQKIKFLSTHTKTPLYDVTEDGRWLIMGDDSGLAYVWDTLEGDRYCATISEQTEQSLRESERRLQDLPQRPAHTGPIVGVALSRPDRGRDYPAFAATFGEENKVKVWELFPILDSADGLRSRNVRRYPVSRAAK